MCVLVLEIAKTRNGATKLKLSDELKYHEYFVASLQVIVALLVSPVHDASPPVLNVPVAERLTYAVSEARRSEATALESLFVS